jgi:hypothetical protein
MFICSFIGLLKRTMRNYEKFLFHFIGISFAGNTGLEIFIMNQNIIMQSRQAVIH